MESLELKVLLRNAKQIAMKHLNSLTVANAPPEKLIEMRGEFEIKIEEVSDSLE